MFALQTFPGGAAEIADIFTPALSTFDYDAATNKAG